MVAQWGGKRFQHMADFLEQKVPVPSTSFKDLQKADHDHAYMVSGANTRALAEDFFNAILAAEKDGETLKQFQGRFDEIVEKHGWDYHGNRGWRSKLIYETNLRQAYNAGREAQHQEPAFKKANPYKLYKHSGNKNPRKLHKSWDGLVLPVDDPWWLRHSPQNGLGCLCKAFAVSERYMRTVLKKTEPDTAPDDGTYEHIDGRTGEVTQIPLGVDPGFDYTPGKSWLRHNTPSFLETWPENVKPIPVGALDKPALPVGTVVSDDVVMPDGLPEEEYVQAFLNEFGTEDETLFLDVLGEPLAINDNLFKNAAGELKVSKDKLRHRYVRLLARALKDPDEIWSLLEPDFSRPGKYRLKRRYIAHWQMEEDGQMVNGFSAFEYGQGVWTGNTIFVPLKKKGKKLVPFREAYMDRQREGVLLYKREEDI